MTPKKELMMKKKKKLRKKKMSKWTMVISNFILFHKWSVISMNEKFGN